ncbi:MAG TPA: type II toxin-antitoxin system RelE/ParE family toxin [Gemmataceae bacterium]|jgi:plasmid stabilization system protein ParE
MRVARFHHLAGREYREARNWYRARSPGAAQRFVTEVEQTLQWIESAAEQCSPGVHGTRWARVHRYDYVIHFYIVDDARVRILAVAHPRRRPNYWVRRLTNP